MPKTQSFILDTDPNDMTGNRAKALSWIKQASKGVMVVFQELTRSKAQNRIMWDWLNDFCKADPLNTGFSRDQYKACLMVAFGHEVKMIAGFKGAIVPFGLSTSSLTVKEMADFLTFTQVQALECGVTLKKQPDALSGKAGIK